MTLEDEVDPAAVADRAPALAGEDAVDPAAVADRAPALAGEDAVDPADAVADQPPPTGKNEVDPAAAAAADRPPPGDDEVADRAPALAGEDEVDPADVATADRLAHHRVEIDPILAAVIRARAASALFGAAPPVRVGRYELASVIGAGGGGAVFVGKDPDLTRDVAIKLIPAPTPELRERALAEGQALARLAHPNVVQVFDVGTVDDRVYLVMELVRGRSLRDHAKGDHAGRASLRDQAPGSLRDAPPDDATRASLRDDATSASRDHARRASRREIIRAYRDAGLGLAAAHEAGLVHRDFKPDNAVIGADGRVRVIDFGLALADGVRARTAGTPRYMAPEQRRGAHITAACDQYAFAASLREAIGTPVPGWLDAVIRRATADDPAARFPSLTALLAALANDPRTRWRRRALIAVPIALVAAGFVVGRGAGEDAPPCDAAAALAPVWTAERGAGIAAHLGALATPFAAAEAPRVRAVTDAYVKRWLGAHDRSCAANRRSALTPALYERRLACLASARTRLDAGLDLVVAADAAHLDGALRALAELPDLDRCTDDAALGAAPRPPPHQAVAVTQLAAELDRADVGIEAATPHSAQLAASLRDRARAIGYRPVLARALLAEGRALLALDQRKPAIAPLAEASAIAVAVGDEATAVEAAARAMWARASGGMAPEVALGGNDLVAALAERLGPRDRFAPALLALNTGVLEMAAGHPDRARDAWLRGIALATGVTGPGALELTNLRIDLALVTRDEAERARLTRDATAIRRDRLGADHPMTLQASIASAFAIADGPRALSALRAPCTRLGELHPTYRTMIVECESELGWLELAHGSRAAARASFQRIVAASLDGATKRTTVARAYVQLFDGDAAAARRAFAALAATGPAADAKWWQLLSAADIEIGRAAAAADAREAADARARAIAMLDRAFAVQPSADIERRLAWLRGR